MGVVEFGRVFEVSDQMTTTQDFEYMVLDTLLKNYQECKRQSFPEWKGFPEIKSLPLATSGLSVTWYAAVPKEYVRYESDIEEELWQL